MSDRLYLHAKGLAPGKVVPGPDGSCGISIAVRQPESFALVGAWPETQEAVREKLRILFGFAPALQPGGCVSSPEVLAVCLPPGRILVLSDAKGWALRLRKEISPDEAAVLDLGQSRAGIRLSGERALDLLAKELAIDLDRSVFPVAGSALTVIDHVGALVIRLDSKVFDLFVPSSFGQSFVDWACDAALEFGYSTGEPAPHQTVSA